MANEYMPVPLPMPPIDYSMASAYRPRSTWGQPAAPVNDYTSMGNWGVPVAPNYQLTPAANIGLQADPSMLAPNLGARVGLMGYGPTGPAAANAPGSGGFVDSLRNWGVIDSIDKETGQRVGGWGGLALGAAQGLGSLYLGMQQYNLAKDALASSKSQFERNFAAQKATTNSALETRQDRRNTERSDAMATADYMSKYGVR